MDSGADNFRQESAEVCLIFMSDRRRIALRPLSISREPERERERGGIKEERDKEGQGRGTATFPSFPWTPWNVASEERVVHHLPLCLPSLAFQSESQGFMQSQSRAIHLSLSSRALGLSGHACRCLDS